MADDCSVVEIVLLGDSGCGKSTFLSSLVKHRSAGQSDPPQPLRDHDQPFEFRIRARDGNFKLRFFDTAFPENYVSLNPHLVVFCFDIGNPQSLASVRDRWHQEAMLYYEPKHEHLAKMLLGLKRDLRDSQTAFIDPYEALDAAQSMRFDQYAECSVTTSTFVDKSFEDIVHLAVRMCLSSADYESGGCRIQ